jgi:ATP-binding cassette subfamily G (WHITE) protein 2 (SNQ2)
LLTPYHPQNYGIICAFGVGFLAFLLTATEYNTSSALDTAVTLFKKGVPSAEAIDTPEDEEKPPEPTRSAGTTGKVTLEKPATNDIFTWQHIRYTVPVSGGERRLLDDVSGYVAPGKVTALMGESGAGKVRLIFFVFGALRSASYHRRRCSMF